MVQFTQNLSKKYGSLKLVYCGFLINCFFMLFLGPNEFLPKNWILVILGLLFSGISSALINGPIISLFIDILNKKKYRDMNCDIAGFLFNFFLILGQFIGPIIGGFIIEYTNFIFSCNLISIINLIYFIVFYFTHLQDIKNNKNNYCNNINSNENIKSILFNDFSYKNYNDEIDPNLYGKKNFLF